MTKNSINPELSCFCTGTHVPNASAPLSEGIYLEFDGRFRLICAMNRPTAKEKQAFKSGTPYKFDLVVEDDVTIPGIFKITPNGSLSRSTRTRVFRRPTLVTGTALIA